MITSPTVENINRNDPVGQDWKLWQKLVKKSQDQQAQKSQGKYASKLARLPNDERKLLDSEIYQPLPWSENHDRLPNNLWNG
jgi:hypothetical protein